MKNLLDSAVFTVNNYDEAKALFAEFDATTKFVKLKASDIRFAVIVDNDNALPKAAIIPGTVDNGFGYVNRYNPVETLNTTLMPDALKNESAKGRVFIELPNIGLVPMSEQAIADLQFFVGLRGEGVESHCVEEMDLIHRLIMNHIPTYCYSGGYIKIDEGSSLRDKRGRVKEFEFTVMYREDPDTGNKKVFSCRTGRYLPIKQAEIERVIDAIQMFGKAEMQKAEATHFMTSVYMIYPEVGEQFTKAFNLGNKKVVPGFKIRTSDTGDSSFCIEKYLYFEDQGNLRFGAVLPSDDGERSRLSAYHYGKEKDFEALRRIVNTDMFTTFKKFPERIAALTAMGEINVKDGLTMAFQAMKLRKTGSILSEDKEKAIVNELAASMGVETAPAYFVAMAAVTAGDNTDLSLSANQRDGLKARALMVFNANFSDLATGGVVNAQFA